MVQEARDEVSALFETFYADLLRYAARRVGQASAPDVVGEVFVVVCRRPEAVPHTYQRAWLFTVASWVIQNQQRGDSRRERLIVRLTHDVAHHSGAEPEWEPVHRALAQLSEADQELLRLIEWDEVPADEAAVVLGCSRSALRVRLHRARRRFAAEYERATTRQETSP